MDSLMFEDFKVIPHDKTERLLLSHADLKGKSFLVDCVIEDDTLAEYALISVDTEDKTYHIVGLKINKEKSFMYDLASSGELTSYGLLSRHRDNFTTVFKLSGSYQDISNVHISKGDIPLSEFYTEVLSHLFR